MPLRTIKTGEKWSDIFHEEKTKSPIKLTLKKEKKKRKTYRTIVKTIEQQWQQYIFYLEAVGK